MKIKYGQRKAISPIIATVLIIAVTLIAAVAIGGFVFGLFGSSANTANVQAINAGLTHFATGAAAFTVTCQTTAPSANFIQLSNSGSANTVVTAVSITYGGQTYTASALTGCAATPVTAGSTLYVAVSIVEVAASTAGQQFNGVVTTANGGSVLFTGTFA